MTRIKQHFPFFTIISVGTGHKGPHGKDGTADNICYWLGSHNDIEGCGTFLNLPLSGAI